MEVACVSSLFFVLATWMLNDLAFQLSPIALVIVLAYSYTKRVTSFSHLILGLSLAIAPVGGWVAVRGELEIAPFYIATAVLFGWEDLTLSMLVRTTTLT